MKKFIFTVDDNIRCFKEICERGYSSIFEHPYLDMYKGLHEKFGLRVQLNLFYECEGFCLADMTDKYKAEFEYNADWLKMSFHSRLENVKPYKDSGYDEVFADCSLVNREILRFAGENSLAKTTTVHYCLATYDGLRAIFDNGYRGLLGLYGTEAEPRSSYKSTEAECERIRQGESVTSYGIAYAGIDLILNLFTKEEIEANLSGLLERETIKVMIHEQYFYKDYEKYIPDFESRIEAAFCLLSENGYKSDFFENML